MKLAIILLFIAIPVLADLDIEANSPIPAEIWSIGEDIEKEIYDAVILEDITEFESTQINRYRKIRILTENGKSAAEFQDDTGSVKRLVGRVVDRSGQEVGFSQKEDLVEVLAYRTRGSSQKSRILVPPGLTPDCVVELSWRLPAEDGLPQGSYYERFYAQEPFYCLKKEFRITATATRSSGNYLVTRFVWTEGAPPSTLEKNIAKGTTMLTYRNLPASRPFPFGNRAWDRHAVYLLGFKTFPDYTAQHPKFWSELSKDFLKSRYSTKVLKTGEYKSWIKDLKKRLPEDHLKALAMIYQEFRSQYTGDDLLTAAQKESRSLANSSRNKDSAEEMADLLKRGYGPSEYLGVLFYQALKDLDHPAKMVFTASVRGSAFQPQELNPFNLQLWYPMFGYQIDPQNWFLVCPGYPEYEPGYVPPVLQGGPALVVDPADGWKPEFVVMPRLGADSHQLLREYQTSIAADGAMRFEVKEQGSGELAADNVRDYYGLPVEDRHELLRKRWQRRLATWKVTEAHVEGGTRLGEAVKAKVTGTMTLENAEGSKWFSFSPFPGDTVPIGIPSIWPADRTQPIILRHCINQVDLNKINVPDGWRLRGKPSWEKANEIGTIKFVAVQEGNLITVRRDIQVRVDMLKAEYERPLKYFIAWMEESWYQNLGIIKGGGA